MANHDVVLGMAWLRQHNPTVDWMIGVLKFEQCNCAIATNPTRFTKQAVDENGELCFTRSSNQDPNQYDPTSAGTNLGKLD